MSELPSGTVTFLFTDIEGSTRLWEDDVEGMRASLPVHQEVITDAVTAQGGVVFKDTGDGICASFESAAAAVRAAATAQDRMVTADWNSGPSLRVRMGIHTGEALPFGGDYHGPPLNRCARLMDAGHGGQVLVSRNAADLARNSLDDVKLLDLGEHRLKDLSEPERIFQIGDGRFPPLRTLEAVPNNLSAQISSFIGRDRELDIVSQLLADHRLVTLTGVGGTGKTRLALQTAADLLTEFPDGVFVVELAPLGDPALVAERLATSIEVPSLSGEMGAGRDEVGRLIDDLQERTVLLVLDNCEHLVDATARVVDRMLAECPRVRILATSREALGIIGEQAWRVPSMTLGEGTAPAQVMESEAARLLVDRVRLVDPDFELTDRNASVVGEICRRLDGMPLALELAAARVATMAPDDVLARLDNQFRLLTGGSRTAVERHQTLRAAIDWSFDLLSDAAQRLLPRLSVFSGGWTLAAAEAVCPGDGLDDLDVIDALTELVDKSLVMASRGDSGTRYQMVEPVRQYAAERLADTDEGDSVRDRHSGWVGDATRVTSYRHAQLAEAQYQRAAFALAEYDNFTEAVRWRLEQRDAADALAMLAGASLALLASGQYREGLRLCDRALADETPCWLRYFVMQFSAYLTLWLDDAPDAERRVDDAVSIGEDCAEVTSLFWVTLAAATIDLTSLQLERFIGWRERLERSRDEALAEESEFATHYATFLIGIAHQYAGEYDDAVTHLQAAYDAMKDFPLAWVPYAPANIAQCKVLLGSDDALDAIATGEAVARASGDPAALASALVAKAMGSDLASAREAMGELLGHVTRLGLRTTFSLPGAIVYAFRSGAHRSAALALGLAGRGGLLGQPVFQHIDEQLREILGDEFEALLEGGARRSADEVLAEIATLEPEASE